ncbi:hypothetical protein IQ781_27855 (plasmid) [Bacillus sp. N447-1]|uniref:DUF4367 domain-containing protein n=1 Tax=Bacillus sp. N447-1 TaxID=2789208 RepID=UPI001F6147CF|nr:DUF4367 domain-containing protein [Bacillus sp. N447-1]UNT71658.1 hypothetical protein IQ781_27855 [Bacillus sp. N447-1]
MRNKYNDIMSRVKVTPAMQGRIMQNIRSTDLTKKEHRFSMLFKPHRKMTYAAACFLVLLTGVLMNSHYFNQSDPVQPNNPIANPGPEQALPIKIEFASLQELIDAVGFKVREITEIPFEVEKTNYSSVDGEMAEIYYSGVNNNLLFRMAPGINDISVNHQQYSDTKTVQFKNEKVTIKGNKGKYELAIWNSQEFSYSLSIENGISEEELLLILQSMR